MSTKPRATSEYMTPVSKPPMITSSRNCGLSAMLANGVTKTASRKSMASALCDLAPLPLREREGPIAQRWEGEGGGARGTQTPHPDPPERLSKGPQGEREKRAVTHG